MADNDDYDPDHAPLNVRIVSDTTHGGLNDPQKNPSRIAFRRYQIPAVGLNGPSTIRLVGNNQHRAHVDIWTDDNNVGILYLTDSEGNSPHHGFGMAAGATFDTESTAQIFAFGTAGDYVYVAEASFDA